MLLRRAAGCLMGLFLVIPLSIATAVSGYFVEDRLTSGLWLGALAFAGLTLFFGLVTLSATGFAQQLVGRSPKTTSPTQGDG